MTDPVEIVEVAPRDGLQMETHPVSTATKLELIRRLLNAGVKRFEVTSFVHPKKVPQMADAEAVLAGLHRPEGVFFAGLILNRKGFDRAVAAGCNEVGMAVVASDAFNRRNQGVSTEDSMAAWLDIAAAAHIAGIRPQITISAAFGCPFEGEVPVERVVNIAEKVARGNPHEIAFADTIGVAVPCQVAEVLTRVKRALPGVRLRCHFHNTRNTGIANAQAAIDAGVEALDASVGGIGGCPFAPAATGNIATEDLVYLLDRSGIQTGLSLPMLIETASWLQDNVGHAVPGALLKAGVFPRPQTIQ